MPDTRSADPAPACAPPGTAPARPLRLRVNGRDRQLQVETWVTLLDLLRDRLGLTGSKKGCDHGQCGACTVIVNGRRINACLTLAVMHDGHSVTTVEGLAGLMEPVGLTGPAGPAGPAAGGEEAPGLHPMQQAFIDHDAFQCGYCTPGQLCSAVALLDEHPPSGSAELQERMSGNLCRCGAYPQITAAVSEVLLQHARGAARGPEENGPSAEAA